MQSASHDLTFRKVGGGMITAGSCQNVVEGDGSYFRRLECILGGLRAVNRVPGS